MWRSRINLPTVNLSILSVPISVQVSSHNIAHDAFFQGHIYSAGLFLIISQKWVFAHQNCLKASLTSEWTESFRVCHKMRHTNRSLLFSHWVLTTHLTTHSWQLMVITKLGQPWSPWGKERLYSEQRFCTPKSLHPFRG